MKLRIAVDQRQAIRLGFNADSTVVIDLDVSQLHKTVRDFIADRFFEGKLLDNPNDTKSRFTIVRPDSVGLMEGIMSAMKAAGSWVRWEEKTEEWTELENQLRGLQWVATHGEADDMASARKRIEEIKHRIEQIQKS